jgi:mannose/fructose/N-acetylgalactosamine-specific phosphotransferase system component IIC
VLLGCWCGEFFAAKSDVRSTSAIIRIAIIVAMIVLMLMLGSWWHHNAAAQHCCGKGANHYSLIALAVVNCIMSILFNLSIE